MPRSHLHVKLAVNDRPVRAMEDNFCVIEWDVAISWQLQGLCRLLWGLRPALFLRILPCKMAPKGWPYVKA